MMKLESELQKIQNEATIVAGGRAFEILTELRRRLAHDQILLADTQHYFMYDLKNPT